MVGLFLVKSFTVSDSLGGVSYSYIYTYIYNYIMYKEYKICLNRNI